MSLTILNNEILRRVEVTPDTALHARVHMTPINEGYMTTVTVDIDGTTVSLYACTHSTPAVPAEVADDVSAFNADPHTVWWTLVGDILDAEAALIAADRAHLREASAELRRTRRRLLGKG